MTALPDKDMAELRRLGTDAAPAAPSQPHVAAEELARMRKDDDSSDLDAAYRHVAGCAACRARLLESAALPERVAATAGLAPERAPAPVIALPPRRRLIVALAAAAAVALAIGAGALGRRDAGAVAIAQRSYVGMMGTDDAEAAGVAPEDADVELSFTAPAEEGATLVVMDGAGRVLSPVRSFTRSESGRFVAVVAPRTFAAHAGTAFGLVVIGDAAHVREAVEVVAGRAMQSLDAAEGAIRARGGAGVSVERIAIGSATPRE